MRMINISIFVIIDVASATKEVNFVEIRNFFVPNLFSHPTHPTLFTHVPHYSRHTCKNVDFTNTPTVSSTPT